MTAFLEMADHLEAIDLVTRSSASRQSSKTTHCDPKNGFGDCS